jgi:hypothetical protein
MRIIQSPGVQITEIDLSLSPSIPRGTDIFITGFTQKGPTDAVIEITGVQEFEQVYGIPTNASERYLYYTAKQILDGSNGRLLVNRLPYGAGLGDGFGSVYSALVYPVTTYSAGANGFTSSLTPSDSIYCFGTPKLFELTSDEYYSLINGSIQWSSKSNIVGNINSTTDFASAGMIVLNKALVNTNNRFEGYYVGVVDNSNVLPTTDYNSIQNIKSVQVTDGGTGVTNYTTVPSSLLNFTLTSQYIYSVGSVSQVLENGSSFDTSVSAYSDTVTLGVFKLFKSPYAPDSIILDYLVDESYNGSLDYHRQINNPNFGQPVSYYIGQKTSNARNITVLVNDNISNRLTTTWLDGGDNVTPSKKVRFLNQSVKDQLTTNTSLSTNTYVGINNANYVAAAANIGYADSLFALGAYTDTKVTDKDLGNIPGKLDRILSKIDDDEIFNIDLICEAGLGTIYTAACANSTSYYDDIAISSAFSTALNALTSTFAYNPAIDLRSLYTTVFSRFNNFAEVTRKDCLFIADPLRHIFVTGANNKTIVDANKAFSTHIWAPIRRNFELCNTSYATTYANWAKVNDVYTGTDIWVPFSGFAAADMANTDENFYPWYAPAGYTRGRVIGAIDLAVYPKQKERDQLYKIGINPVTLFPSEGFVIFGQKTLLKKPSAFDRINVRRMFLYVEKATKKTVKYFVFEPNTLFTRTQVVNTLSPIFETVKQTDGVYDFLLVCDERNNTPNVIDQNELVVDVYLKPVRAGEFILVNFYSTRTSTNFNELVGA